MGIKKILYGSFVIVNLGAVIYVMVYTVIHSLNDPLDFPVFYGAARNALYGLSIYTYYGIHHFPFWYFPWTSWIFIPLAIFSRQVAWIIYLVISFGVAFLAINAFANHVQRFSFFDRLYMFSMSLWMGWLAFRVGQMSFLILGATVLIILLIGKGRSILSGLLIPLLLIKPHLFIIFIPLVLWLGGKKTLFAGTIITLLLFGVETVITPHWAGQMLSLLVEGTKRVDVKPYWDFSTFPTLLGFSQNYSGTANLPFTIPLVAIAAFVVIRFRSLPKIPLLSLAMAASLFCAPRSYEYDLVLLIPATIWLSEKWSFKAAFLWAVGAIIPIFSHYSAGSYLVTLIVFTLCIYKAYTLEKQGGISRSFFGKRKNAAC
jgi:hypothetical protein